MVSMFFLGFLKEMIFEKPLIKAYLLRTINAYVIIGIREVWNLPI